MDLDQVHLPDPIMNDIIELQTDNIQLRKKVNTLEKRLNKLQNVMKEGKEEA
jgi:serine O-acetyltransferase